MSRRAPDLLTNTVKAAHAAIAAAPDTACAAAVAMRESDDTFTMHGNMREIAALAGAICGMALNKPRPTDCSACADAWDTMSMAHGLLRKVKDTCQ